MADKQATLLLRIKEVGGEILDRFVITLGDVTNILRSVVSALGDTFEAFKAQEDAVTQLNQSMINQGVYSADLENRYIDLASALSKVTRFGDEQIVSAQAILQQHVGNREVTKELVEATLNLASAKKMDLDSAAQLLGKTISSENDLLKRQGIYLDESAAKHDRLGAVVQAVNGEFGNLARKMGDGVGATDRLNNAFGEVAEFVGKTFAPAITKASSALADFIHYALDLAGANDDGAKSTKQLGAEIKAINQELAAAQGKQVVNNLQGDLGRQVLRDKLNGLLEEWDEAYAKEQAAALKNEEAKKSIRTTKQKEAFDDATALKNAQIELEIANTGATEEQMIANQIAFDEKKLLIEKTTGEKKLSLKEKQGILERQLQLKQQEQEIKDRDVFLNTTATLARSQNTTLATIGKAAAITQIAIKTPEAVASSFAFGARIGGPPLGFVFGGIASAAMAAQAAQIAGIQLAEGGIVRARPGGIQATIGEGGQDEAVIPLDRAGDFGFGGGGNHFHFHGPVMGDQNQAKEFALAIDKQLLELRRSGESVAFDEAVV